MLYSKFLKDTTAEVGVLRQHWIGYYLFFPWEYIFFCSQKIFFGKIVLQMYPNTKEMCSYIIISKGGDVVGFNDHWKLPKKSKQYFSPKQEKQLKEKYGIWYTFHTILSIIILIVPLFIFLFLSPSNAFSPTTQNGNLLGGMGFILGLIGSMSVGVGLVNIFMSLIKQYLGHLVTLISIIGGLLLDILGLFVFSLVK